MPNREETLAAAFAKIDAAFTPKTPLQKANEAARRDAERALEWKRADEARARRALRNQAQTKKEAAANLASMKAGVAEWIEDASTRSDGAALLRKKSVWVGEQIALMGQGTTPAHLRGLTVWDLTTAQGDLDRAARALASELVAV